MLQSNFNFPIFQPDQILTSGSLNEVFNYLDEQERLTRVNLIGIGIVCGFDVTVSQDGTSITIGQGCGVTSEGYLITTKPVTYGCYQKFSFAMSNEYDPFCTVTKNTTGAVTAVHNKYCFDQLFAGNLSQSDSTYIPLSNTYLNGKVLVLLYDMNDVQGQNCNPESCDGKGVEVDITIRPLLMSKADADSYLNSINNNSGNFSANIFYNMADMAMHRFDVPLSSISTSGQFYAAYKKLFTPQLISTFQNSYSGLYNSLRPLLINEFPNDPFANFTNTFSFLYNGTLTSHQNSLLQLQYFYDLFVDMIHGFNELKEKGFELTGSCCPDPGLFPRHLFAGIFGTKVITISGNQVTVPTCITEGTAYYDQFMPSRVLAGFNNAADEIQMLFRRLVLQYQSFALPSVKVTSAQGDPKVDPQIKITPTLSGRAPLSLKSIPVYYNVPVFQLQQNWNYQLKLMNKGNRNLSYYASTYNTSDSSVYDPLSYDLEEKNFLRVEGHIGKPYTSVLYNLQTIMNQYRLPFKVTIVTTGFDEANDPNLLADIQKLGQVPAALFADLDIAYKTNVSEIVSRFVQATKIIYKGKSCLPSSRTAPGFSKTVLLKDNAPDFLVTPGSIGSYYEEYVYPNLVAKPYQAPLNTATVNNIFANFNVSDANVFYWTGFFAENVEFVLESIYTLLTPDLATFANSNLADFNQRYTDLENICAFLIQFADEADNRSDLTVAANEYSLAIEDIKQALEGLLALAKGDTMNDIATEYLARLNNFAQSITFNTFSANNPGIQHRAGVPLGGTLVLVVHFTSNNSNSTASSAPAPVSSSSSRTLTPEFLPAIKSLVTDPNKELIKLTPQAFTKYNIDNMFLDRLKLLFTETLDESASLEAALATLPSGTVIADFFVPYIISSDVPPANFTINTNGIAMFLIVDPGTFVLNYGVDNPDDSNTHGDITYGPLGGVLTIDGKPIGSGGDYTPNDFNEDYSLANNNFSPFFDARLYPPFRGTIKRAVPITYTLNGNSIQKIAYVYYMPVASFKVQGDSSVTIIRTKDSNGNAQTLCTVVFDFSASQFYNKLVWGFGDNSNLVELDVTGGVMPTTISHTYDVTNTTQFTVVLTAFNDTYLDIASFNFNVQGFEVGQIPRAIQIVEMIPDRYVNRNWDDITS